MKILLVGGGAMAAEVAALAAKHDHHCHRLYHPDNWPGDQDLSDAVVVHFGSGRLLPFLVHVCAVYKLPLIQGSTNVGDMAHFAGQGALIIDAPNLSLVVAAFMAGFTDLAKNLIAAGATLMIEESHQATKRDPSGTALAIVRWLGLPESIITSWRSRGSQEVFGVPFQHLGSHAYHTFYFRGRGGEDIRITIKINGRRAYAEGTLAVAQALVRRTHHLDPGVYQLRDIIARLELHA